MLGAFGGANGRRTHIHKNATLNEPSWSAMCKTLECLLMMSAFAVAAWYDWISKRNTVSQASFWYKDTTSWCPGIRRRDPALPAQHKTAARPIRDSDFPRILPACLQLLHVCTHNSVTSNTIDQPYLSIKCTMSSLFCLLAKSRVLLGHFTAQISTHTKLFLAFWQQWTLEL